MFKVDFSHMVYAPSGCSLIAQRIMHGTPTVWSNMLLFSHFDTHCVMKIMSNKNVGKSS